MMNRLLFAFTEEIEPSASSSALDSEILHRLAEDVLRRQAGVAQVSALGNTPQLCRFRNRTMVYPPRLPHGIMRIVYAVIGKIVSITFS